MHVTIFFDGGTRVHHGIAAGAAVVLDDDGKELGTAALFLDGETRNNVAEYTGLIIGLQLALALGATQAHAYGDSELVLRQVNDVYQTKKAHLIPLRNRARELGWKFSGGIAFKEIPKARKIGSKSQELRRRNGNERADRLCSETMDCQHNVGFMDTGRFLTVDEIEGMFDGYAPEGGVKMDDKEEMTQADQGAEKFEETRDESRGSALEDQPAETQDAGVPEQPDDESGDGQEAAG